MCGIVSEPNRSEVGAQGEARASRGAPAGLRRRGPKRPDPGSQSTQSPPSDMHELESRVEDSGRTLVIGGFVEKQPSAPLVGCAKEIDQEIVILVTPHIENAWGGVEASQAPVKRRKATLHSFRTAPITGTFDPRSGLGAFSSAAAINLSRGL